MGEVLGKAVLGTMVGDNEVGAILGVVLLLGAAVVGDKVLGVAVDGVTLGE